MCTLKHLSISSLPLQHDLVGGHAGLVQVLPVASMLSCMILLPQPLLATVLGEHTLLFECGDRLARGAEDTPLEQLEPIIVLHVCHGREVVSDRLGSQEVESVIVLKKID